VRQRRLTTAAAGALARPKIGWIVPGFSASEADWCIPALLDTARALAAAHDLHIYALRYPHDRRRYTVYGARVTALGGGTTARLGRAALIGRALAAITAEHRRAPFDALHGVWADEPGFIAALAGRMLGARRVVSLMGGELVGLPEIGYGHQLSRGARLMIAHSLRAADAITAGSAAYAESARAWGVSPEKLNVAPLGVDDALFMPDGPRAPLAGEVAIVHAASLEPIKDQATLLRALALARASGKNIHLHLLGDGRLRAALASQAAALGIADAVSFHGNIPRERLPDYFRAADFCLLTSRHESQSLVALEAAACGRITVGTRVGVLPELVDPAWLVMPGDVRGLAAVMARLAGDAELRAALGRRAREIVAARLTLATTTAAWARLYVGDR
jgi:glycosyltransferase involved in cell wall biosynthesis